MNVYSSLFNVVTTVNYVLEKSYYMLQSMSSNNKQLKENIPNSYRHFKQTMHLLPAI